MIRVIIFVPGFYAAGILLDHFCVNDPQIVKEPLIFWADDGIQGIWGLLCLVPYPNFLFRKRIKFVFAIIILIGSMVGLSRALLPAAYYRAIDSINDEIAGPQHSTSRHYNSYGVETGSFFSDPIAFVMETGLVPILVETMFWLGPLLLVCIRIYEVRHFQPHDSTSPPAMPNECG